MKRLIENILPVVDILLLPFVYPAGWLMKNIRKAGLHRLPLIRRALIRIGVFPINNHYFEPQFDYRDSTLEFSQNRPLPGIDWNTSGQLEFLEKFNFSDELEDILHEKSDQLSYHFNCGSFDYWDAEYWYQLIRTVKPNKIFEIGSGNSTLMAINAIKQNKKADPDYKCDHICIEPYEMPWLEETGVSVIRKKVEDVGLSFFKNLKKGDILFIDSSHVIRPQGDVLFEYLELLPSLNKGIIVHIHDIFSPQNYPKEWLQDEVRLWNEQYLLEAFLTNNDNWKIVGALNYLYNHHYEELKATVPFLSSKSGHGSFYIQKLV